MSLIQRVYISRATRPLKADEVLALLETSRVRNAREGITGLLVYHGETFMQLLEGDGEPVGQLYDDICRDERNTRNHVLYESNIAVREFADWSMAFVPPEALDTSALQAYSRFLDSAAVGVAFADRRSMARRFMLALRDELLRHPGRT